ncbi:uncharacterized protein [Musca autumnalis]|uniref:uncharacterized protein n=1 Tax=Musca autumnalis TaxID=221902 RepID=UPI003CECAF12
MVKESLVACVIFWVILSLHRLVLGTLLYPASTVFQITSSISLPIVDLPPTRKAFFDWGFQMNYNMPFNLSSFYMTPIWPSKDNEISKRELYNVDLTPAQVYSSLENILERHGYDKTCWKRSICELAHYPFDKNNSNWLTEIITFVMSPSLHPMASYPEFDGFFYQYHLAERQGHAGYVCHQLYSECKDDFLKILSSLY